jgi:phosphoglycerate dehydrogenase-like enzyme
LIKVLLADTLSQKVIERLNEIPEFEIVVKTGLNAHRLKAEIKDYEAVVVSGTTILNREILQRAGQLKIIVRAGIELDNIDVEFARSRNIEVRNTPFAAALDVYEQEPVEEFALIDHEKVFPAPHPGASTIEAQERAGFEAISILREFFNV